MTFTLATLETASRFKMAWMAQDNMYAPTLNQTGLPANGPWTSGSTYMPFDAHSTPEGESPTSYSFYGRIYSALATDCALVKVENSSAYNSCVTIIYDLLWISMIYTTSTLQTVNSNPFPARDILGSANGVNCYLVAWVAGGANITVTYTNSAGIGGRTATVVGTLGGPNLMSLQAGDEGVQSIQDVISDNATPYRLALIRRVGLGLGLHFPGPLGTVQYMPNKQSRLANLSTIPAGALLFATWSDGGSIGNRMFNTQIELARL